MCRMTLNDNWGMIGHRWAVDMLARRLDSGRLGHAYLITGPSGSGRSTLALRLAQAMNCTGSPVPCGVCRSCDLIAREGHADIHRLVPDGRSIKIEQVRNLQHDLALRPVEAPYRVAIIEQAQTATGHAADALLKTLEEPPPTTRLILTADAAENLLPTMVSRCQVIALRPVPVGDIAQAVASRYALSADEASMLAHLAGGRPGWALRAAEDPEVLAARAEIFDGLLGALAADRGGRFSYVEGIYRSDALPLLLDTWQSWWRDVLLLAEGSRTAPVNADRVTDLERVAASVTPEEARRALRATRQTIDALERNANTRLALDVLMLDMPYL